MSNFNWTAAKVDQIWAEPDDQGKIVQEAIVNAKQSVDIVIYEMGGPQIMVPLKQAKQNGVAIRIIFNGQFFAGPDKENKRYDQVYANINELQQAPGNGTLEFHWSSNNFSITHQKTIIIDATSNGEPIQVNDLSDNAKVLILTMNLCQYAWMASSSDLKNAMMEPMPWTFWQGDNTAKEFTLRDFGAVVTDPNLVYQVAEIFEFDFKCGPPNKTNCLNEVKNGLVWSNGSKRHLY